MQNLAGTPGRIVNFFRGLGTPSPVIQRQQQQQAQRQQTPNVNRNLGQAIDDEDEKKNMAPRASVNNLQFNLLVRKIRSNGFDENEVKESDEYNAMTNEERDFIDQLMQSQIPPQAEEKEQKEENVLMGFNPIGRLAGANDIATMTTDQRIQTYRDDILKMNEYKQLYDKFSEDGILGDDSEVKVREEEKDPSRKRKDALKELYRYYLSDAPGKTVALQELTEKRLKLGTDGIDTVVIYVNKARKDFLYLLDDAILRNEQNSTEMKNFIDDFKKNFNDRKTNVTLFAADRATSPYSFANSLDDFFTVFRNEIKILIQAPSRNISLQLGENKIYDNRGRVINRRADESVAPPFTGGTLQEQQDLAEEKAVYNSILKNSSTDITNQFIETVRKDENGEMYDTSIPLEEKKGQQKPEIGQILTQLDKFSVECIQGDNIDEIYTAGLPQKVSELASNYLMDDLANTALLFIYRFNQTISVKEKLFYPSSMVSMDLERVNVNGQANAKTFLKQCLRFMFVIPKNRTIAFYKRFYFEAAFVFFALNDNLNILLFCMMMVNRLIWKNTSDYTRFALYVPFRLNKNNGQIAPLVTGIGEDTENLLNAIDTDRNTGTYATSNPQIATLIQNFIQTYSSLQKDSVDIEERQRLVYLQMLYNLHRDKLNKIMGIADPIFIQSGEGGSGTGLNNLASQKLDFISSKFVRPLNADSSELTNLQLTQKDRNSSDFQKFEAKIELEKEKQKKELERIKIETDKMDVPDMWGDAVDDPMFTESDKEAMEELYARANDIIKTDVDNDTYTAGGLPIGQFTRQPVTSEEDLVYTRQIEDIVLPNEIDRIKDDYNVLTQFYKKHPRYMPYNQTGISKKHQRSMNTLNRLADNNTRKREKYMKNPYDKLTNQRLRPLPQLTNNPLRIVGPFDDSTVKEGQMLYNILFS